LLSDNYVDLVLDGRKATLRALLAAFPADAPNESAELALACATCRLYDGLLDESAAYLTAAEPLAGTVPDERRRLFDLRLASARLWLACQRGDLTAAKQAMSSFRAVGPDELRRSNDHRASALMNLGVAELWSLHLDDARHDLEEALALARRIGRPYLELGCLGHLAVAAVLSGEPPTRGLQLSEEAVTIAEAHGWAADRVVAPAVAAGAGALAWLGHFHEAEQWLSRVEHARAPAEELDTEPVFHFMHAFVHLGQRRFGEALAEFRAADRMRPLVAREHALPGEVRGWIVQTQVQMGDTAAAHAALVALRPEERDGAGMRIAAAALALAEGRPQDAVDVLAPMLADVPAPAVDRSSQVLNARRATVHALLLDAVARDRLGDPGTAEASIERALELAERDGMILQFVLVPVRELLERHPRHRTAHATLLSTILDVLAGAPPPPSAEPIPLREELSEAELRVVGYLPTNLKAPEIAAELYVSPNTVRTHLRHIYAKFDTHSRGEAVARARSLGLLSAAARRGSR
jgi:LuxR family maltose regulon positive regulatory protein